MIIYCIGNNWMSRQFIKEFEKKDFEYILNDIDETDNNLLSKIIEKNISHVIYFNNFLMEDELKDLELIDNLKNHLLIPNKIALFCQRYFPFLTLKKDKYNTFLFLKTASNIPELSQKITMFDFLTATSSVDILSHTFFKLFGGFMLLIPRI